MEGKWALIKLPNRDTDLLEDMHRTRTQRCYTPMYEDPKFG
jgi:hypothetical protein